MSWVASPKITMYHIHCESDEAVVARNLRAMAEQLERGLFKLLPGENPMFQLDCDVDRLPQRFRCDLLLKPEPFTYIEE